jgi:hypothetical protein
MSSSSLRLIPFFEIQEGSEAKEKDEHRDTENTEGHREKRKIFIEEAKSKTKS